MELSPPAQPGYPEYTSRTRQFPLVPVSFATNTRAANVLRNVKAEYPRHGSDALAYIYDVCKATCTKLAEGGNGVVYRVDHTALPRMHARLSNRVEGKALNAANRSRGAIIKVITLRDKESRLWNNTTNSKNVRMQKYEAWLHLLRDGTGEALNHKFIMEAPPVRIECSPSTQILLQPKDIVPEMYFAGADIQYGVYVIAMSAEDGVVKKPRYLKTKEVALLEKAILTMLAIGIEHGDLHFENILFQPESVKFIDFGMSLILPETMAERMRKLVQLAVSRLFQKKLWPNAIANSMFHYTNNGMLSYVDAYIGRRFGTNWFNPSWKMLAVSKKYSPKAGLDAQRLAVWTPLCTVIKNKNKKKTKKRFLFF